MNGVIGVNAINDFFSGRIKSANNIYSGVTITQNGIEYVKDKEINLDKSNYDRYVKSNEPTISDYFLGYHGGMGSYIDSASLGNPMMNEKSLAEHIGYMGKALDEAYKEGQFSKEEYDDLNNQLDDYRDNAIERYHRALGARQDMIDCSEQRSFMMMNHIIDTRTVEEVIEAHKAAIDQYVKDNPIDLENILRMIQSVRYGQMIN